MTQNPELIEEKELVNSTENTALASSNMGEAGWRLMTQKTAKQNLSFQINVPYHPLFLNKN